MESFLLAHTVARTLRYPPESCQPPVWETPSCMVSGSLTRLPRMQSPDHPSAGHFSGPYFRDKEQACLLPVIKLQAPRLTVLSCGTKAQHPPGPMASPPWGRGRETNTHANAHVSDKALSLTQELHTQKEV